MFKKTGKRNLRQRKEGDSVGDILDDGDDNGIDIAALKAKQKKKSKAKKTAPKPEKKAVLSFAGDEEEEDGNEFQLKKPSRNRRIAKHIKKLAQEEREQTENKGGEYTKERLAELKKTSLRPESPQRAYSPSQNFSGIPGNDGVGNNVSSFTTNGGFTDLRPGEIPDANRIHAARKQRELMRKYGSDYIPVENTDKYKNDSKSRLVREDDIGSNSDEDGPSVAMTGAIDDAARVVREIGDQGEGSLNRDEEFDMLEAEMIKKGISTQRVGKWSSEEEQKQNNTVGMSTHQSYHINGSYETPSIQSTNATPKTAMAPEETISDVKKRISDRLECIKQVHSTHKQDFDRAISDVKDSENSSVQLGDLTSFTKQYTYFQDMKAYITDLLDCLGEKNLEIEALGKRRHRIWKERADIFVSRRQQDVADESSDITSSLANIKVAPTSTDKDKQTRIREREARRSRRRSAREHNGSLKTHIDGTSTDEEESSMDRARLESELDRIEKFKETLFEDVVEEFYDVQVILSKFDDWREKHPDSYNDAYIGLCLPKLISPFVRLAILHWNPLEPNCMNFEEMRWYQDLLFFGVKKECTNVEVSQLDPDTKVLSSLFDKVVLPKLTYLVREIWDPMSSSQSHRLSLLLCRSVRTYPCMRPENKRCNELLLAICTRLQRSIDSDVFIPLYPSSALVNISSGPGAFFERQTWICFKLFENVLLFNGILSPEVLQELAFTALLNRYIMLSLQTSPITTASVHKCQRIIEAVPSDWLKEPGKLVPHFASFTRYLLHSAKHIHGQLSSLNDIDKRKARTCIEQLSKMLLYIGSSEESEQVSNLLGIKTLF